MTSPLPTVRRAPLRALLATAACAALTVGCTASSSSSDDGVVSSAACADHMEFGDRTYESFEKVEFTAGEKAGTARRPVCDDTPDDGEPEEPTETATAYRIDGLPAELAIAVEGPRDDLRFYGVWKGADEMPAELKKFIDRE